MGSFKLGEKEIKVPVIQGGMGIGISLGNLAGTVAREGGIGLISAAQIVFWSRILKKIRWKRICGQ